MDPTGTLNGEARTLLHQLLLDMTSVRAFLDGLAAMAAEQITDDVSCGITVLRDGRATTVANSDLRAAQVDEIQYSEGQGPCLHAARHQELVHIEDVAGDHRWAGFEARALAHGIGAVFSVPVQAGDDVLGAMNFYASTAGAFGPEEQDRGHQFAEEATRALELAVRLGDQVEMTEQLKTALTSRAVIDQAIGVIMSQNSCNAEEAFAVLRAASQTRNVKLRDVAVEVIAAVGGEPSPLPIFVRG